MVDGLAAANVTLAAATGTIVMEAHAITVVNTRTVVFAIANAVLQNLVHVILPQLSGGAPSAWLAEPGMCVVLL